MTREETMKHVYLAKVSVDRTTDVPDLDSLDAIIRANTEGIEKLFGSGYLNLKDTEVLIIRGGRGSIKAVLDQYRGADIFLVRAATGAPYAPTSLGLGTYLDIRGCYVKRPIGRENTTYITISASNWKGHKFCPHELPLPQRSPSFKLADIADAVIGATPINAAQVQTK
jgi:hypothetical protein